MTARHLFPFRRGIWQYITARHIPFFQRTLCTTLSNSDIDMELSQVVKKLNAFAPTTLAGSWDNVGLLVEPTPPHKVNNILLTNDLTEAVMSEAIDLKADMILAYHPPIFTPMKRLTQRTWKERIVIKCLENRIAVYAPHTCFDAIQGGVNDWLLTPFGKHVTMYDTGSFRQSIEQFLHTT